MDWKPCPKCDENGRKPHAPWGRSPLCFHCLIDHGLLVYADGGLYSEKGRGTLYAARYRFRRVRCGKDDCNTCKGRGAHSYYVYLSWRVDGRAREKYLGPSDYEGDGYDRPELRAPVGGFGRY